MDQASLGRWDFAVHEIIQYRLGIIHDGFTCLESWLDLKKPYLYLYNSFTIQMYWRMIKTPEKKKMGGCFIPFHFCHDCFLAVTRNLMTLRNKILIQYFWVKNKHTHKQKSLPLSKFQYSSSGLLLLLSHFSRVQLCATL